MRKIYTLILLVLFTVLISISASAYSLTVSNYDYLTGQPINATVSLYANRAMFDEQTGEAVTFTELPGDAYFGIYCVKENYKTKTLQENYQFTQDVVGEQYQARYTNINVDMVTANPAIVDSTSTVTLTILHDVVADTNTGPVWRDSDIVNATVTLEANGWSQQFDVELVPGQDTATNLDFVPETDLGMTGGTYDMNVTVEVQADQWSGSDTGSVTLTVLESDAPVISNVVVNPADWSANVSWNTNERTNATVYYGTLPSYGLNVTDAGFAYQHNVALPNLTASAHYYYNIEACDVLGNCDSHAGEFNTLAHVNQPPVAQITMPPDQTIYSFGSAINFSGNATDLEDGVLSGTDLVWSSSINGNFGNGTNFDYSGLSVGNHTITLTATDSNSADGTDTIHIEVANGTVNNNPLVTIHGPASMSVVGVNDQVTFNGSATDMEDGVLAGASLEWSSNRDGVLGNGEVLVADLTTPGIHVITLTATDSGNLTGTDTISLQVRQKPVAVISAPADASIFAQGAQVDFAGSATDAEDGTLSGASLEWSSDLDGVLGTGSSLDVSNLSLGNHVITLTATDSDNMTGSDSVNLEIATAVNYPPSANIVSPADGSELDTDVAVNLQATVADAEDGTLPAGSIVWTSDRDGVLGNGSSLTVNLTAGVHVITVNATDSGNKSASDSVQVTVYRASHIVNSWLDGIWYGLYDNNFDNGLTAIYRSNVTDTNVTASDINMSVVESSVIINSNVLRSTVLYCWVENSTLTDAYCDPSRIINSVVSPDSNVTNSNVTNSNVLNGSTVTGSVIEGSDLTDVDLVNSNIDNTALENVDVQDASIDNGVIHNGTVTDSNGTVIYNNDGDMNLTDFVNYAPAAEAGSDKTVYVDSSVSFDASASTDANLASSLFNETLAYEWDFGDGNSSSGMQATHAYASQGTYTVTLTVTDKAGESDTDILTVTVNVRNTGGGSPGSHTSTPTVSGIILDTFDERSLTVKEGDSTDFVLRGEAHTVAVDSIDLFRQKATFTVSSDSQQFVLHTGETKKLDVDGGDYYDMTITLDKLSSKGAEFTLLRIHELMPGARPPIPMPQRQTNASAGEPAVPEDDGFAGVPDAVLTRHILTPILMLVLAIFVALDVAVLFVYLILRLRRESYA